MPIEYEGLVGRQDEKASSLFERSRSAYQGETPIHRKNDLALACPLCRAAGNKESRMFAQANAGYFCMAGHKWNDMDQLMALSPDKLEFKGMKARQEGWRPLQIEMPGSTLEALQAKYKDRLGETLAAFIDMLTQDRFLVMGEEDLVRIEQWMGMPIRNARDLAGAVFAKSKKIEELQEQVDKGPEPEMTSQIPGVVMVNCIEFMDKLVEKAKNADPPKSVSQFLTDVIREQTLNDWI